MVRVTGGEWVPRADLPKPGRSFGVAILDGKLYAIGGYCGPHCNLSSVDEYDPDSDAWTARADLPEKPYAPAAVGLKGKLYALGGANEESGILPSVAEYDPETDTGPPRPTCCKRVMPIRQ